MEKRILVVDDDLNSREGLKYSLLGQGHRVETAADAWQAIKKINEGRFDIAIIDLDLPPIHGVTVSGWDLARIFRVYNPVISLIVVGVEDNKAVRTVAEQLGVAEFLEKPINPSRLKAVLRDLDPSSAKHPTDHSSQCSGSEQETTRRRDRKRGAAKAHT